MIFTLANTGAVLIPDTLAPQAGDITEQLLGKLLYGYLLSTGLI